MRIYRTLAAAGLALGVGAWVLDVASAQQHQQHVPPHRQPVQFPNQQRVQPIQQPNQRRTQPIQPVQHVRPAPQPLRPFPQAQPANPLNNPGAPVIGGQQFFPPIQSGTTPINGMSNGYLGGLANSGYLGGFANGNLFLNPNLAAGFNPLFGFNSFNSWGNPWMNGTTWGNPFANPYTSMWNNPWAGPFNQFSNPWNMNAMMNPYGMNPYGMNAYGMNPYGMMNPMNAMNMNPFQIAFPQGPFAPNPLMQGNGFGGFLGGQAVGVGGQQPQAFQPAR